MAESYAKRPMWQWVLIYLILGGIVYWLVYAFVFAKNGGYQTKDQMMESGAFESTSPGAMTDKSEVQLAELNDSGESGTAMLEEVGGKVTVTITLSGSSGNVPQPAHLHTGACPGVGAVKYPLTNVVNGASVTTLEVTLEQLKAELPLALNVHKSAAESKIYTSCGGLSL